MCVPLRYEGRTKYSMTLAAKIQMVEDSKNGIQVFKHNPSTIQNKRRLGSTAKTPQKESTIR